MTSVAATTASTASTSASTTSSSSTISSDQFLQILMTQLKNQNPLDPMDVKDFTAQLTSYSQLEQQIETNTKLESLTSLLSSSMTALLNGTSSEASA